LNIRFSTVIFSLYLLTDTLFIDDYLGKHVTHYLRLGVILTLLMASWTRAGAAGAVGGCGPVDAGVYELDYQCAAGVAGGDFAAAA
jgi:hypothetical protein